MMKNMTIKDIDDAQLDLFDFSYDWDEKGLFEKRFNDTYYYHEIGFSDFDEFKHYLRSDVQRKAPIYQKQYEALDGVILELERGASITRELDSESGAANTGKVDTKGLNTELIKELGLTQQPVLDWDNLTRAVKNVLDNLEESESSHEGTGYELETVINKDIPLNEAIENVKAVKVDIIQDFIGSLRDLFSLIY